MTTSSSAGLILVAAAAFLLPIAAGRLRMPAVVFEIVFGIAVGPVLGLVPPDPLLDALAGLGFLLLLFLAGFEIDLGVFERQGSGPVGFAVLAFGATIVAAFAATRALGLDPFMTLVLATTSVGLVVPTLRTTRWMSTPLGQDILLGALVADLLSLVGVTVIALAQERGPGQAVLALPAFLAIWVGGLLLVRRAAWWWPEAFARLFEEDDPDELGIRFSLALMLGSAGLATVLGIEPILGAFLAGIGVAAVFRVRGGLDRKLAGFAYGFLIPIFFIDVGIGFRLDAVADLDALGFTILLFLVATAVKVAPSLLLVLRRHPLRDAVAAGFLLSARLSLIIVVAELGNRLGVIDPRLEAEIILLAAVSATAAPVLFRWTAGSRPIEPAPERPT